MKIMLKYCFCLLSLLLSVSCVNTFIDGPGTAELNVVVADLPRPKATGVTESDESAISSLQVLVFDPEGTLVSYGASSSCSVSLKCTCGPRAVWAFANSPSLSEIRSLQELNSLRFSLEENGPGHLVMAGREDVLIEENMTRTIQVSRLCAKVVLCRVSKAFTSDILQNRTFMLDKVYMTNVAAEYSPAVDAVSSIWYNKMGYRSDCDALLCDSVGSAISTSLDRTHTFYVYPNRTAADVQGGAWSPRFTRLVLKTALDGADGYYVISIPDIRANHSYVISDVILNRPGAPDEEHWTSESGVKFSLKVSEWSEFPEYYENL